MGVQNVTKRLKEAQTATQRSKPEVQTEAEKTAAEQKVRDHTSRLFQEAARITIDVLQRISDLSEINRRSYTYGCLATHALPALDIFPIQVFLGPPGTGKTGILKVGAKIAYRPWFFCLRNMTYAVVRDRLGQCADGTIVADEANGGTDDAHVKPRVEALLSDRYDRSTAQAAKKDQRGGRVHFVEEETCTFGATILAQRTAFLDGAIHGRSIVYQLVKNRKRTYEDFESCEEELEYARLLLENVEGQLPEIDCPAGIPGRIFKTYKPLLIIAELCGDKDFVKDISERLKRDTSELDEDQSTEPAGLALRALIQLLYATGTLVIDKVWLKDVVNTLEDTHKVRLNPRQVSRLLRGLGVLVKESHGQMRVMPTRDTLLKACELAGYDDDEVREDLLKQPVEGKAVKARGRVDEPVQKNPPTSPTRPAELGANGTWKGIETDGKGRRGRSPCALTRPPSSLTSPLRENSSLTIPIALPAPSNSNPQKDYLPASIVQTSATSPPRSSGRRISIKPSDQERSQPLRRG